MNLIVVAAIVLGAVGGALTHYCGFSMRHWQHWAIVAALVAAFVVGEILGGLR